MIKFVSNLLNIQTESFKIFMKEGLKEELKNFSKIRSYDFDITFNAYKLQYKKPRTSLETCLLKNKTFSVNIICPMKVSYKGYPIIRNKKIVIGQIPLLTEKGTFVINGKVRVIISQIIRSPGVYLEEEKSDSSVVLTVIPDRGSWLTIKLTLRDSLYTKFFVIKKRLPILLLVQAMGVSIKKFLISLGSGTISFFPFFVSNNLDYFVRNSILIFSKMFLTSSNLKSVRQFIYMNLLFSSSYHLSLSGRKSLNKKLFNSFFRDQSLVLTPEDVMGSIFYLLKKGRIEKFLTERDSLENKKVRSNGELLRNKIRVLLGQLKMHINENVLVLVKRLENDSLRQKNIIFFNEKFFINLLRNFFTINQLSQILSDMNPLAEVTHKRKIAAFSIIERGSSKSPMGVEIREIHPSHYSRICPIETAEGKNAGLVLSLSKNARVNKSGFVESPFYLRPFKFIRTSYDHIVSVAASSIPFLGYNDANRVLMGSNMQRQSLSLLEQEKSIVRTDILKKVAKYGQLSILTEQSCYVRYVSSTKIIVSKLFPARKSLLNINYSIKKKLRKQFHSINKLKRKKVTYSKTYFLKKYRKSNDNVLLFQKPFVRLNSWQRKKVLLAGSSSIIGGSLALGRNLLVAYMGWEGYNFEDAIVISKRLVLEDIFTSLHVKKYKTYLIKDKTIEEKLTRNISQIKIQSIKTLKKNGIIRIGTTVRNDFLLVGKIKILNLKSLNLRVIKSLLKDLNMNDVSLRVLKNNGGVVTDVHCLKTKNLLSIIIFVTEKRRIKIGDKISGRHGNKGIVSKILPLEDMPYLEDGTIVDVLLNPLGIPSRMNLGQIFESMLGLLGKNLCENYQIPLFSGNQEVKLLSRFICYKSYQLKVITNKHWLCNPDDIGKSYLFDGKTGRRFIVPVAIGYSYMLKLMHMGEDKVHARSIGPYSSILNQPLKGKSKQGGQRIGEMEVWALEGFGAAYFLQELFTVKSDDLKTRSQLLNTILKDKVLPVSRFPESFKVLVLELQSLCLDLKLYKYSSYSSFF
uniref:DNA-directed RNA polymerase subunit beta n=1 Tax=Euglenaformis proxima TaxID=299110 RepID=A0A023HHX1_9EUGL|nr:RNA polymerase beta subunit [Euglenaformis proxima]AGL12035.1 RNA polymerase beta subunit [Euglenaformis proxima]